MTYKRSLAALLAVLCFPGPAPLSAKSKPLELKWNELAPFVSKQTVQLVMPGGAKIKGQLVAVREDALVLDVRSTTDLKAYPKGSATIPRASVTTLNLERPKSAWGRVLGTVLGMLSGMVVGGYTAYSVANSDGTGIAVFLGVAAGFTLAGYFLGRELDRKSTEIKVVP